jgi:hypothetical protein
VDGADDLAAVDALEVDAGDAKVGVSELALDDDQRDAFVRHFDRVSVPKLVGREPTSHASFNGCMMELLARSGCVPAPSGSRSVDHAQHGTDWQLAPDFESRVDLLPSPAIHSHLPALAALSASDEYGTVGAVEIALL